eukprot:NODE_532_length_6386_cov_0.597264.p2 type:complete len:196 gc:universal NODE_532_length_6386_cov_0.597264:5474-4887(-)
MDGELVNLIYLGFCVAHPAVLKPLMWKYFYAHSYGSGVPLQLAMSNFLNDPASSQYLSKVNETMILKKQFIKKRFLELNYPSDALIVGECTSYMLFEIPPKFHKLLQSQVEMLKHKKSNNLDVYHEDDGYNYLEIAYREHIAEKCGLVFGYCSMINPENTEEYYPAMLRMFLGPSMDVLAEAMDRLEKCGFGWSE